MSFHNRDRAVRSRQSYRVPEMGDLEMGATAIEYGLIAALISIACIGAMRNVDTKLNGTFTNVETNL